MSKRLTILHLAHEAHGAGSSVSIALLARAQRDAGHAVAVACPPGDLAERLMRARVTWRAVDFTSIGGAARAIRCLTEGTAVSVVNAHSSRARAACRRLRFAGRLPAALVMTRRSMPHSSIPSAIASGLAADRVIAVSRTVARALVARGTPPWRLSVVYNAVDLERVDRAVPDEERQRARAQIAAAGPLVGVVSRRKDHTTLLAAMRHVPATLVSLGFTPDAATLRRSGAATRFLPFQEPGPFYDLFDVVVLPTREEGLSQGLLEAMALGKPVVTTSVGSNREIIEDGVQGLLVPPGDAGELAAAIRRLLDDRELAARIGAAARRHVRARFTIERTLAGTEEAYRKARERRRGTAAGETAQEGRRG